MNNKIFTITILIASFFLVGSAYAVSQSTSQKAGNSSIVQTQESQVINQEIVKRQNNQQIQENLNEELRVRIQQQIQKSLQDETGKSFQIQNQGENQQIQNSQQQGDMTQRRSRVANAVQEMLQVAERNEGISGQIRVIAQNQNQNQERIEKSIQKIQKRNSLTSFFAGPDYREIDKAKEIASQNNQQIEKLNQLKDQVVDSNDQQQLIEQIESLKQANLEVEDYLQELQKGFSLFGWLFKLISK
ncbi:MAG: transmembrane(s)protein [Parcubacteria bacterium 34_609]|jgi:valyl-tRNA synthetase|nr:MAG: transmembrane(s)protein [Parcubacteria bacterium 34_609]